MKIVSIMFDGRINAQNILLEMSAGEYLLIASQILDNNEYQRRRVRSSNAVYSLLKEDFMKGCVLPPVVLGLNSETHINAHDESKIDHILKDNIDNIVILDGLQRTYSLLDLQSELQHKVDDTEFIKFSKRVLRVEMYLSINRIGVLYRMLTLNTGQTPMSIRQQVEMLYLDYIKKPFDGIQFIREVDEDSPSKIGEYTFKSVVDGFNSYIERSELPIDRGDVLENIKGLEKLSIEGNTERLFEEFITTFDKFIKKYDELLGFRDFSSVDLNISGQPFGKNVLKIFAKSQVLTGFGAAMGKLKDIESTNTFFSAQTAIDDLKFSTSPQLATEDLLKKLEKIRLHSKKIGNSQRLFFVYYFRELLNPESDSYCDASKATEEAYRKYETQVM
jgi:hypothetical protein